MECVIFSFVHSSVRFKTPYKEAQERSSKTSCPACRLVQGNKYIKKFCFSFLIMQMYDSSLCIVRMQGLLRIAASLCRGACWGNFCFWLLHCADTCMFPCFSLSAFSDYFDWCQRRAFEGLEQFSSKLLFLHLGDVRSLGVAGSEYGAKLAAFINICLYFSVTADAPYSAQERLYTA